MKVEEELHVFDNMTEFSSQLARSSSFKTTHYIGGQIPSSQSKYGQLLQIIEEIGKDLRPSYAGSRCSAERLKRSIINARTLIRECLNESSEC